MNPRFLLALLPLLLWTCATPAPVKAPVAAPTGPDDDHHLVTRQQFEASAWKSLPTTKAWVAEPSGIAVTLTDGRTLRLGFVAASVVRWWVPAAPGEEPLSPAAVMPRTRPTVKIKDLGASVVLDTPSLTVEFHPADLSWTLLRGDKTVVQASLRSAGRRLAQDLRGPEGTRWVGIGTSASSRSWSDRTFGDESGPWAAPGLFAVGAAVPFAAILDNSYQTYTRFDDTKASLGALNGGLDLLVSAAPQPASVVEALTSLVGRPTLPPQWAYGTALVLPDSETGAFVRSAKLSVQTAVGRPMIRQRFQSLVLASSAPLPDLTDAATRTTWLRDQPWAQTPGNGFLLGAPPAREDWNARFDDGGRDSPLARMNNRLGALEAVAVRDGWQVANPTLRPFLLSEAVAWGTTRQAWPVLSVKAGNDADLGRVLALGALGLSTPAIRLDLTPLADAKTHDAAFQSLLAWSVAPLLTLDWGSDPAAFWAGLGDQDRTRLKAILDRRSQFKPLFAQNARATAASGRPAWQPLWFLAPADPLAARDDEFLVGDGLLAAPVLGGASSRTVYLPGPGVWFDFWSGEEFGGGQSYTVDARADKPLLFARGGAVIPQRETESFDDKDVYNPLTVHVFPGGRGAGTYYADDGRTLASSNGAYWETRLVYDFSQKEMSLDHQSVNTTGALKADPYLLYRIHNVFRPKQAKIDGKAIPLYGDSWGITDSDRSAAWYESDHTLLIKTFKPEKNQTIVLSF